MIKQVFTYCFVIAILSVTALVPSATADNDPRDYAVQVSASVSTTPSSITLSWPSDANATGVTISRKSLNGASWTQIATLAGNVSSYVDSSVSIGSGYEYQLRKTSTTGVIAYGYIYSGIQLPLTEQRGTVVLVVDNTIAASLSGELSLYTQDLIGDGWSVIRHDVSRTDAPASVKSLIIADYNADPVNTKAVFLFGHIPVPYSGNFNPDEHPDHQGATPADVYYGDMDGNWTDNQVNGTQASRPENQNVIGDGKFDPSTIPSNVELAVGRVDFFNMTCYANKANSRSELDLLRNYLAKDHQFRFAQMSVQRRGLVCDNFGEKNGEAFASSGWRNFAPFFGAANVTAVGPGQYFPTVSQQSYLWTYACGGGSFYTCAGVGGSDDFSTNDIQAVFTMFFGSYFDDWDNESNFLRAPLGSGLCLATMWAGRPHWFLHPMALGETIGSVARMSQNNGGLYLPQNIGTRGVHMALMGDPTLRMHPVAAPSGLSATSLGSITVLSWNAAADSSVLGYHVYRATSIAGPYVRLTDVSGLQALNFIDLNGFGGSVYMVRAFKLEQSASGSYYNASQGVIAGTGVGAPLPPPKPPVAVSATPKLASAIAVTWNPGDPNTLGYRIERKSETQGAYQTVTSVDHGTTNFSNTALNPRTRYYYRLKAFNTSGESDYSNEASAVTPDVGSVAGSASFVREDASTSGNWSHAFGTEASDLAAGAASFGGISQVSISGADSWMWADQTSDTRGLLKTSAGSDRQAAAWYAANNFSVNLSLNDGNTHSVAFYFLDWDRSGRQEQVQIVDQQSGVLLDSRTVSDFGAGKYLVWQLGGNVQIRVTSVQGPNVVMSGIFIGDKNATSGGGGFRVRVSGNVGQTMVTEASSDLSHWAPMATNVLTSPTIFIQDAASSQFQTRFYRSRPQ